MAKPIYCAFCGTELTRGWLSGDAETIKFNIDVSVDCCEACKNKYGKDSVFGHERFGSKICNYKKNNKLKLSEKEIANLFIEYLSQQEKQKERTGTEIVSEFQGFFTYNENGYFGVREFQQGFWNRDINTKDMVKSMQKSMDFESYVFDKNDITKIQFRRKTMGDTIGLFKAAYTYDIILNDEKEFSYKPCLTRSAYIGSGLPFLWFLSADKKVKKELEFFKKKINSDLPIQRAK